MYYTFINQKLFNFVEIYNKKTDKIMVMEVRPFSPQIS